MADGEHISELGAVDVALGVLIASAFDGLGDSGPEDYRHFLSRPMKEKVFRTQHDSALALVKKVAASKKGGAGSPGVPDLPLVAYYRKPGLTNGDEYANILGKVMWNDQLTQAYRASVLPVALDYSMTMCSWDKLTLDKMQLAWYARVSRTPRFVVPFKIDEDLFEQPARVTAARSVLFTDASEDTGESRLWAVNTGFTVVACVMSGAPVTVPDSLEIWGICRKYIFHGPGEWTPHG